MLFQSELPFLKMQNRKLLPHIEKAQKTGKQLGYHRSIGRTVHPEAPKANA